MFLEVRKNPKIYVQHNAMDAQYLAPVTSHFRINLGLIAEVSIYSIKEVKTRKSLDGMDFELHTLLTVLSKWIYLKRVQR